MKMLGFLFAVIAGAAMSVQGVMNTRLQENIGLWEANAFVQGTAFVLSLAVMWIFGKGHLRSLTEAPWWNLLGGALGLVLWGVVAHAWLGYEPDYLSLALAGLAVNAIGQLGDLSMSLIKREAGVKDYSHIFLTHGGMLDRFDSTLFIAPWIYLFVCAGL